MFVGDNTACSIFRLPKTQVVNDREDGTKVEYNQQVHRRGKTLKVDVFG